jgi:hypothetical protein
MKRCPTWDVTLILLALFASAAHAQTPQQAAAAHFAKGATAYNLDRWDDAVKHFTDAYEAAPRALASCSI